MKDDAHLVAALVYVSLNPVRAGVVTRPEEWPWCSYGATVGLAPAASFLAIDLVLELFGDGPREVGQARFIQAVRDSRARDAR